MLRLSGPAAVLSFSAVLALAACGGGGSSATPTPAPTVVASPRPATQAQFQIAYVDNEKGDIWVAPADGVGPRNIGAGGCPRPYPQLYWSPAGDRIACISSVYDGRPETQILVLDLLGRPVFHLDRDALFYGLSWPDMMEMSPSSLWSPTGQYLAYALEEDVTPDPQDGILRGTPHLIIVEAEQGHILKSIPGGQQPRWSTSGHRIAYNEPPGDTLVVYDLATRDEKVVRTGLRPLAWVLHDTSLLVAAGHRQANEWVIEYEANLLDLSSGEMTRVPELDDNAEFWLSPDGTKAVVLGSGPSLGVLDLVRLRLTDIEDSVITYPSEYIPRQQLTFTLDGSRIYWFDGLGTTYSAKSDGSDLTRTGPLPQNSFVLGFSPNAGQVMYSIAGEAGLWVVNVDGSDAHLLATGSTRNAAWGPPASLAKPARIDGVRVVPLWFGEEVDLPEDVALIIETGCWQCDGPPTGVYRLFRDPSGELRADTLLTLETVGVPLYRGDHEEAWANQSYITGLALSDDASQMAAGVCTRGYCDGLGFPTADAQTTLYRSSDGGVTWTQVALFDGGGEVTAITDDGVVVSGPYDPEDSEPKFTLFPGGQPVQPPQGPPGTRGWPLTLPDGDLAWRSDGRLLRSDGSELLSLSKDAYIGNIVADSQGERFAVTWSDSSSQSLVGVFSRDGRAISAYSNADSVVIGGWLNDTLMAGNVGVPSGLLPTPEPGGYLNNFVPAILDLEAGEARPLVGPFHELPFSGRNYVRAVIHGPFARVVDTGSCLNVRAEPGIAAPVLTCAADGVLLRDSAEARDVEGTSWRRVVTPAGIEGWASEEFLER